MKHQALFSLKDTSKQELRKRGIKCPFKCHGVSRKFMQEQLIKHKCLEKINQRSITWNLRKGEQSFLYASCCPNLILFPIKLHEDIPNCYRVMAQIRMFGKQSDKGQ